MSNWPRWVLAGVLATLTMDLGSTLVRLTGWTAGLPPPLMGRWFTLLAHGQFSAHTIADDPADAPGRLRARLRVRSSHQPAAVALDVSVDGLRHLRPRGPPELMLLRSSFVNHVIFALGLAIWTTWLGLLT
jgi:hypothetical protein